MRRIAFLLLCAAPAFGLCSDWSATAQAPFGIVADMDGDGRPDVVTFGLGITIRYGDDFSRSLQLRKNFQHSAIAVADFDHDGHPDIAAGQPVGGPDELLLYRTATEYETRTIGEIHPSVMLAADLDGDGVPDLVAISGNDVITAMNDGHGNFAAPQRTGVRAQSTLLAAGDFDGDHKADVAVVNGDVLAVYRGDGRGGLQLFPSPATQDAITAITAADLDRDGRSDLLLGTRDRVLVLRSTGSGFTAAAELQPGSGSETAQIAVADADHDGTPDVLVAATDRVAVWRNAGGTATAFRRAPDVTGVGVARGIVAADLNADGLTDILIGPFGPTLIGRGNATFTSYHHTFDLFISRAAKGDVDGDGDTDAAIITITFYAGGSLSFANLALLRNVSGTLVPEFLNLSFDRVYDVATADLDGDGRMEIVLLRSLASSYALTIVRVEGSKATIVANFDAAVSGSIAVGDFDGDGRQEIAYAYSAEKGRIVKGAVPKVAAEFPLPQPAGSSPIDAADFDGDGRDDLVLLRIETSSGALPTRDGFVAVLFSQGDGTFADPVLLRSQPARPFRAFAGDFDGDGRPDVAIYDEGVFLAYANGRSFDVRALGSDVLPAGLTPEAAADLDGDGRDELIAVGFQSMQVLYLGGRGEAPRRIATTSSGSFPTTVLPIDTVGGGRIDLLAGNELFLAHCPPFREHRRPR
jgi:hypothetical protein